MLMLKNIMKTIIFLSCLIFNISAFAAPSYYTYGSTTDFLNYMGSTPTYDLYATSESLAFLETYTTYKETKIWQLDVLYAPNNEKARSIMINTLTKDPDIHWWNTPSNSRKLWGVLGTMGHDPSTNFLRMRVSELFVNDNGEVIGAVNADNQIEDNDFDEIPSMKKISDCIESYLAKRYPPTRNSTAPVE